MCLIGRHGRAKGDKIQRVLRANTLDPEGAVKAAAQLVQKGQRPAEIDHLALNLSPLGQPGDGLIDHGGKDAGGDVVLIAPWLSRG